MEVNVTANWRLIRFHGPFAAPVRCRAGAVHLQRRGQEAHALLGRLCGEQGGAGNAGADLCRRMRHQQRQGESAQSRSDAHCDARQGDAGRGPRQSAIARTRSRRRWWRCCRRRLRATKRSWISEANTSSPSPGERRVRARAAEDPGICEIRVPEKRWIPSLAAAPLAVDDVNALVSYGFLLLRTEKRSGVPLRLKFSLRPFDR